MFNPVRVSAMTKLRGSAPAKDALPSSRPVSMPHQYETVGQPGYLVGNLTLASAPMDAITLAASTSVILRAG